MLVPSALAQTATETVTVDSGDFTMELSPNDAWQLGEKLDNQVMAMVYVNLDPTASFHENFNVVWSNASITDELAGHDAEAYGQNSVDQAKETMQTMGIEVIDYQLVSAVYENNTYTQITYMDLDYTGAGIPMRIQKYQTQVFLAQPDNSTYIFTFTAADPTRLAEPSAYLDTIIYK